MLCIGVDDTILPNSRQWAVERIEIDLYQCNILEVVLASMQSVLQYVKILSAEDFTETELSNFQKVGEIACVRTLFLFQLKQVHEIIFVSICIVSQ